MKTFYEHWKCKDEIERIYAVGEYVSAKTYGFDNCKFYLSQENGQMEYVYWIVAIRNGVEIERWNVADVENIKWKGN